MTTPRPSPSPASLVSELRSRINPSYEYQLGTESYERRICADVIESLLAQLATEQSLSFRNQVAEMEKQRDDLLRICHSVLDNGIGAPDVNAMRAAIERCKS